MPSNATDTRIRFERTCTESEHQVWQWLRDTYGRNASEIVMGMAVTIFMPKVLEAQGKPSEAQQARQEAMIYALSAFGVKTLPGIEQITQLLASGNENVASMPTKSSSAFVMPETSEAPASFPSLNNPIDPTQILSEWDGEEDLELDNN